MRCIFPLSNLKRLIHLYDSMELTTSQRPSLSIEHSFGGASYPFMVAKKRIFWSLYVTSVSEIYLEALLTFKSHDRTKQNETKRAKKQKHTQSIEQLAKTVGQRN